MKGRLTLSFICCFIFKILAQDTVKTNYTFRFNHGTHFSKPRNLLKRSVQVRDTLRWESSFDTSCYYTIKDKKGQLDIDQWDFNKLTGISFNTFNPLANTAMIGWRYNPNTHYIELLPYWHIQKKRFFEEAKVINVLANEIFIVEIVTKRLKNEVEIIIKTPQGTLKESQIFQNIPTQATLIQPYFGGTSPAPSAMQLYLRPFFTRH